jgi:peroxiredoxin
MTGAAGSAAGGGPRRRPITLPLWVRVLLGVGTVGLIVVLGVTTGLARRPGSVDKVVDIGAAPSFSLPNIDPGGSSVRLSDHRGRPIILTFFASRCAPCVSQLSTLLSTASHAYGIDLVGVDVQDGPLDAQRFAASTGVTFPTALDAHASVAARYGVPVTPATVFIDARGRMVGRIAGQLATSDLRWWMTHLPSA